VTWVKDFGVENGAATLATQTVTVPAGGVAAGNSLLISAVANNSTTGQDLSSITDSKGNTYVVDVTPSSGITTTVGIAHASITTALVSGDTLTFTWPTGNLRYAISVSEFTDSITSVNSTQPGTTYTGTSPSIASFSTGVANTLVFGGWGLVNSGRVLTAGSGYTLGTKYVNTAGGNRAVQSMWKYAPSTTSTAFNATADLSGQFTMGAAVYVLSSGSNAGTLSASIPKLTGNVGDQTTNPATLAKSIPLLTSNIKGSPDWHQLKEWDGTAWRVVKAWDGTSWRRVKVWG
jgi:hypothetical protein